MAWLGKVFRGKGAGRPARVVSVPDDVLAVLDAQNFSRLSPVLRSWCEREEVTDSSILSAKARERGWSDHDVEKLEIFLDYYGRNAARAFERARPFISGERFDPDLFVISVVSLYYANQFEDAYRCLKLAEGHEAQLEYRTDYWITRAVVSWAVNDMEGVNVAIDRTYTLSPDDAGTLENACAMKLELGDLESVRKLRGRFMANGHDIGYAYALNTLALGDYEEGFRQMETRYEMPEAHRILNQGLFKLPRWRGEDISGKTLLVSGEQGLGDTIQMARFFPALQRLKTARLLMETQAETLTLLQFNFPEIEFMVRGYGKRPDVDFDLWVGAMSLPHLLKCTAENLPGRGGYLRAPPENTEYWKARVSELSGGERPRIGLAWSGQPAHRADRRRSVPFARMMDAIRGVDADFFALQTHVPEVRPANLVSVSDEMLTLADTAALVAELDLVITVDTSVVHVAGAVGKNTWLLLPYFYEWRWGLEGETNRWYDSVKVLRQRRSGDWAGVLDDVFKNRLPEFRRTQGEA